MPPTLLSIIIPAHNEEKRLPAALDKVNAFLKTQPYKSEIVLVENGSSDRTLEIAHEYARCMPDLVVIHEDRRGKGLAVQRGMLGACGDFRFICDTDFSMPVEEVNRFIPPSLSADVAIASREAPGAVRYHEPSYRHIIGRVFNLMVRILALPGLQDSQCGFKCFRADVAEKIFPLQTLTGMSFDVEVLYIARCLGYKIVEIPIPWYFDADSRVRLVDDSLRMAFDLWQIRQNNSHGDYQLKEQHPGSNR